MFTGLVEELGSVRGINALKEGVRLEITANVVTEDIAEGASIAVNGVCLTALGVSRDGFYAELSPETLERSSLGGLIVGSKVNLERAVTPTTRLGGHIVQGHVDAKGSLVRVEDVGEFRTVTIAFPDSLARYFIEKGSVAVDGISLTIAKLRESEFDIAVIPKTWEMTNLASLVVGDPVNLEVDQIAKYVERMTLFR